MRHAEPVVINIASRWPHRSPSSTTHTKTTGWPPTNRPSDSRTIAGRGRTRRLPATGDLFGIKVAAAAAEAGDDLDAVAGRRTHPHAPSNGSRLSSTRAGTRPAMDDHRPNSSRLRYLAQLLGVIHRHHPHCG